MAAPTAAPTRLDPRAIVSAVLARLSVIEATLVRMLELAQAPREMLFAAGSITFGGTVGVSPSTCTVNPPLGQPPGVVLVANPHRRGLNIQNLSSAGGPNLTVGLGQTSPQAGTGWVLAPGASWDGRVSGSVWPGSVSVVASAAGCSFCGGEVLGRNERRRPSEPLNLPI